MYTSKSPQLQFVALTLPLPLTVLMYAPAIYDNQISPISLHCEV